MSKAERYFRSHDASGHAYAVPVARREEWNRWLELPEDDEAAWETPDYAIELDGRFTFTDPRCE